MIGRSSVIAISYDAGPYVITVPLFHQVKKTKMMDDFLMKTFDFFFLLQLYL